METASNCPSVVVTYGSGKHSKTARGRTMSDTELTIVGNCDCNIHIQLAFTNTTEAERDFFERQLLQRDSYIRTGLRQGIAAPTPIIAKGEVLPSDGKQRIP